jgi:cation diffusion facilitator family transporter
MSTRIPPIADFGFRRRLQAIIISLGVAILLLAIKFAAYAITQSTALLSDALESVVNVVAAGFGLFSVVVAARPADRNHPYGHGKVEYFAAAVEGGLILAAAGLIVVEAVRAMVRGPDLHELGWGLVLAGAAGGVNAVLGAYLIRAGRQTGSLTLVADGRHVLTDVITTVGVLVGLMVVWLTGIEILDPLIALVVAGNIVWTGYKLLREAVAGLMDEADPATLEGIREGILSVSDPAAIEVHNLRALRSGTAVFADFHVTLPRFFDLERSHDFGNELSRAALRPLGSDGNAVVHLDPCSGAYCRFCKVDPCPVRESPYDTPIDHSIEALTGPPLKKRLRDSDAPAPTPFAGRPTPDREKDST